MCRVCKFLQNFNTFDKNYQRMEEEENQTEWNDIFVSYLNPMRSV